MGQQSLPILGSGGQWCHAGQRAFQDFIKGLPPRLHRMIVVVSLVAFNPTKTPNGANSKPATIHANLALLMNLLIFFTLFSLVSLHY